MNNKILPNDPIYNAEPANVKKRIGPPLSKIYTYPIDKDVKWYKPYPEFENIDQDRYFFKYEYLDEIRRQTEMIKQSLYEEQLRKVIENEIELNEIKREDRQIMQLNNYFKNSMFTSVMEKVKQDYLKAQAQILMRNNTNLRGLDDIIADTKTLDKSTLTLQNENSQIKEELDLINNSILNYAEKKIEEYEDDEENQDILEMIKENLQKFNEIEGEPLYEEQDEEVVNQTYNDVGKLQESELKELAENINKESKEELYKETEQQKQLQQEIDEKKKINENLKEIEKTGNERLKRIKDLKDKFQETKRLNNAYIKKIDQILKDKYHFNKRTKTLKTDTRDIIKNLGLAHSLDLLTEEELLIIKNNFPNLQGSTKQDREAVRNNFFNLFNELKQGVKPQSFKNFMDGIRVNNFDLEKQNFKLKLDDQKLIKLKNRYTFYNQTPITDLKLKGMRALLNEGEKINQDFQEYLNYDLQTLLLPPGSIPNPEGQTWEDLPPGTPFEEEGGAY